MDKITTPMVILGGAAAAGIGTLAYYLYYKSEDDADDADSSKPNSRPSAMIPWRGSSSRRNATLHIAVFLMPSVSTEPAKDLAEQATFAIWCFKEKYKGAKVMDDWTKAGEQTKVHMNKTSDELDEVHKKVKVQGFGETLIKNRCGKSTALAIGPVTHDDIAEVTSYESGIDSPPLSIGDIHSGELLTAKDSLELLKETISDETEIEQ